MNYALPCAIYSAVLTAEAVYNQKAPTAPERATFIFTC